MYKIKLLDTVNGVITVPADKSISHRAVMLSAIALGKTKIKPFLKSDDTSNTVKCLCRLGVSIEQSGKNSLMVDGIGKFFKCEDTVKLNAGESGTTMRILSGILCAQKFGTIMDCKPALRKRPMARIVNPLSCMGASITGVNRNGNVYGPLKFIPVKKIIRGKFNNKIASAQIKTALIFAALYAQGETVITEPYVSRNHTENMLKLFGIPIKVSGRTVRVTGVNKIKSPGKIVVPGDFSSAAFFIVLGSLLAGSEIVIKGVNINKTRTGLLRVLKRMGADIKLKNKITDYEISADIIVKAGKLKGVEVKENEIPSMIDEIPILCVAAVFASGTTVINGVRELKVKETDRLAAIMVNLKAAGVKVKEEIYKTANDNYDYRLVVTGTKKLRHAQFNSFSDHRMAMSAIVLGILSGRGGELDDVRCINKSFPDFIKIIEKLK
ncbi:MAG: 3-phosphoshikimate 1-carboxyvinyltransferase [Candidatus Omnitrophota bacterium]